MYEKLREMKDLAWNRVIFFWGDERFVPHDHPDSNYKAAKETLLDRLAIPADNLHPWAFGNDITVAAKTYADDILATLGTLPVFDLTFLGLGDDAHTASLFPGTGAIFDKGITTICRPTTAKHERLTLTAETLSRSRTVAFLVSGEGKRKALTETRAGKGDLDRYPARAIRALENLFWLTDLENVA
jgi:6-phosphogluconolactonase